MSPRVINPRLVVFNNYDPKINEVKSNKATRL